MLPDKQNISKHKAIKILSKKLSRIILPRYLFQPFEFQTLWVHVYAIDKDKSRIVIFKPL